MDSGHGRISIPFPRGVVKYLQATDEGECRQNNSAVDLKPDNKAQPKFGERFVKTILLLGAMFDSAAEGRKFKREKTLGGEVDRD